MSLRMLRMKILKATKQRRVGVQLWQKMENGAMRELLGDCDYRELNWLGLESGSIIVFNTGG